MHQRWKPSVTVAAIVSHQDRYLLVEEHTPEGLRLNNPAGHLDPGESLLQACVRETLEETAYSFKPTALVGIYLSRFQRDSEDITYLRFAFCGDIGQHHAQRTLDTGIVRALWLTPQEIENSQDRHRSAMVWQCVQDHLRGQRFPLDSLFTHPSVAHSGHPPI